MVTQDEEPIWARTLHALYNKGMQDDAFDEYGYSEMPRQIAIAEEIDEAPTDVAKALRSMKTVGLINGVPSNHRRGYTLTEKGFSVAHNRSSRRYEQELENSRSKRQHDVNRAIGFLTLGLLLMGLIEATISALIARSTLHWAVSAVLVTGLLTVVGIGLLLLQSGLLSKWTRKST